MSERQGTHWHGCWRSHLECAVALIEQLEVILTAEHEEPNDEVFRYFQRLHGLPETGRPPRDGAAT